MTSKLKLLASTLLLASAAGMAVAMPLTGEMSVHQKAGVDCVKCHGDKAPAKPAKEVCFKCHGSYDDVAAKTAGLIPNPHASHMGELECTVCHKAHKESKVYCNDCHTFGNLKMKE